MHVLDNPYKMIESAHRVLREGGRLGITVMGSPEKNLFRLITDEILNAGVQFNLKNE